MMRRQQLAAFVLLFCGLRCLDTQALRAENDLELLFSGRTQSDWQNVWHHETHSRCRHKLVRHLYWACEKDIYRITRRNGKRDNNKMHDNANSDNDDGWHKAYKLNASPTWLHAHHAYVLLRTRRRGASTAPTITSECCTKNGCTWEEYAEYCPTNKRLTHY